MKKINILGTPWVIKEFTTPHESKEFDGTCDDTSKVISIYKNEDVDRPELLKKQTVRHEIIHAYLYECGLGENMAGNKMGHDEQIID